MFKARLSALGYDVVDVKLLSENVPDDAALVAIIGPKAAFKPEEASKVRSTLDAGKPLLVVLGGPEAAGEKNGLEDLLGAYNVSIGSSVILDPGLNYRGSPSMVYAPVVPPPQHPIVDPLLNRAVLMPRPSPIQITQAQAPPTGPGSSGGAGTFHPNLLPVAILRTSEQSWGETDLSSRTLNKGDKDEPGPLNVGVAVTDRPIPGAAHEPKPRLVLFSSRFMADNLFLEVEPTNLDLLINAIQWLRGQAEIGGIAPKTHVALTLAADPVLRNRLIFVPTLMAAMLIIGLGLTTYMLRRE